METRADAWLDELRIASPCSERWEDMDGDERARFCARCELTVHNLAGLTRAEAATLVGEREGRLCIRLARRRDGTILTRDCPVGLARVRRRMALMVAGVVGVLVGAVGLVAAAISGRERASRGFLATSGWTRRLPEPIRKVVEPFDPEPQVFIAGALPAPMPPPTPPAPQGDQGDQGDSTDSPE